MGLTSYINLKCLCPSRIYSLNLHVLYRRLKFEMWFHLIFQTIPASIGTIFEQCSGPRRHAEYTWKMFGSKLIHGHLIYPWIEPAKSKTAWNTLIIFVAVGTMIAIQTEICRFVSVQFLHNIHSVSNILVGNLIAFSWPIKSSNKIICLYVLQNLKPLWLKKLSKWQEGIKTQA